MTNIREQRYHDVKFSLNDFSDSRSGVQRFRMCDRESKDLARKEKKGTPSPDKKKSRPSREDNKENEDALK